MRKSAFIIALILTIASAYAQNLYDIKREGNKFVYGDSLKIFLGDSLFVEADFNSNKLYNLKAVNKITDSSRTIILKLGYEDFGGNKATILKIYNPFDNTLTYKAEIKSISRSGFSKTSIMPVYSNLYSMEMWPYQLEAIILYNFKFETN